MRDQLFARARLAAYEYGRIGARHLRHLLVDLTQRARITDDVAEVVTLAPLLLAMYVLVQKTLLISVDQVIDLDRLRDHRGDDGQKLGHALIVALGFITQVNAEHPDGAAVDEDGNADEAQLLPL